MKPTPIFAPLIRTATLALCLASFPGAALADIYWESTQTVSGGGASTRTIVLRHYFTPEKARMDIGENIMIADFAANKGYVLNTSDRMFLEIAMDNVGKIPDGLKSGIEATATGEERNIDGYACRKYRVRFVDHEYEQWISKDVPGYAELRKVNERLAGLMKANPLFQMDIIGRMDRLDGFPVLTVMPMGDGRVKTVRLKKVSENPIPADTFRVPAGYKPPY